MARLVIPLAAVGTAIVVALLYVALQQAPENRTPSYGLEKYYAGIDYSCISDSDCGIKDVHNCCGYYPQCVNKDAKADPDYVRKACALEGVASACGYPSIDGCRCVQNRCVGIAQGVKETIELCETEDPNFDPPYECQKAALQKYPERQCVTRVGATVPLPQGSCRNCTIECR